MTAAVKLPQAIRYGHRRCGDLTRISQEYGVGIPAISLAFKNGHGSTAVVHAIIQYYTSHNHMNKIVKLNLLVDEQQFLLNLISSAFHSVEQQERAQRFCRENSDIWPELNAILQQAEQKNDEYSHHFIDKKHDGYTRYCSKCKTQTIQISVPYNHSDPDMGDVWLCRNCETHNGFVNS